MKIKWINYYKGILIILMVMGHSGTPFFNYIYLFHMPAFFIISGYLFDENKYSFFDFLKKRIVYLLVPAILINVLFICFYETLEKMGLYSYLQNNDTYSFMTAIKSLFYNLTCADFGGAIWFIFVLFQVEIIYYLIVFALNKLNIKKFLLLFTSIIGYIGYYLCQKQFYSRYMIELVLIAIFYYSLGYVFNQISIEKYLDKNILIPFCIMSIMFFGGIYFKNIIPMNWPTRQFSNPFIQIWTCLSGVYIVYVVSNSIKNKYILRYLDWLGQNTYSVLILHFVVFRLIFFALYMFGNYDIDILKNLTPPIYLSQRCGWFILTIVTVGLCNIVSLISRNNVILNYIFNARGNKK